MSEQAITVSMSHAEAERLTERLRIAVVNYADARQKVQALIEQAQAGRAWEVLGFQSWTAYVSEVLGEQPMRLPREERREMVAMLSSTGMSTRAIAPVVGVSHMTASNDLNAGVKTFTPAPSSTAGEQFCSPEQSATTPVAAEAPAPVQGMDGKTYARSARTQPAQPRRTPLTDTFFNATVDIHTKAETLTRLVADERFPRNREEVARRNRNDLLNTITALNAVVEALSNQPSA